jgi:hypothetical protein
MDVINETEQHSRIERALAVLKPEEKARLDAAKIRLEVSLSRTYGTQLSESTVKNLVDGLVLEPEALTSIHGTAVSELPENAAGWKAFGRELVNRSEDATRDIANSNAVAIAGHKQDALQLLNPQQRINFARNGSLENYLNQKATEALEESLNRGR